MAKEDRPSGANVSIDLGLGAKLEGRIPERSLGRTLDALVDLIRPWTESRGLKADLIRLQREDVALEIAKRARRAIADNEAVSTPPLKVLLPILEHGSVEDINDEVMIDAWANLLASSVTGVGIAPRMISILKDINSDQAKALQYIALRKIEFFEFRSQAFFDTTHDVRESEIRETLFEYFKEDRKKDDIYKYIFELLDRPTVLIEDVILTIKDEFYSLVRTSDDYPDVGGIDLDILQSLGLLRRVSISHPISFDEDMKLHYCFLTELGIEFVYSVSREVKDVIRDDRKRHGPALNVGF